MRILVTGGAGFIGSALCRHLLTRTDAHVLNVDKLTYAGVVESVRELAGHPRYAFLRADVGDGATMAAAFEEFRPDAVAHLAAETHVDRSISDPAGFVETNILGTFVLLEAARRYWNRLDRRSRQAFRFLHVSTDEVYGRLGSRGLFTETTPYDPSSPYSASKASSDHLVTAWHRTYGLPALVSNGSNNYGPYQFPEKFIPLMILNAIEGRPLPLYGDGSSVRDWLFVDDHVGALCLLLAEGRPGERYNVGSCHRRTNLSVAKALCAVLDELRPHGAPHADLISFVEDRPGHDQRYAVDATKIETSLGWRARETLESGLRKTVAWYLDNEWWWRPLRQSVYSGDRLGLIPAERDAAIPGG